MTYLLDLLENLGEVEAKSMFGGYGLYLDGLMFGIVADDEFYIKVDDQTRPEFESLGLEPFVYVKKGKEFSMSYYHPPVEVLEVARELCDWATKGVGAANRSNRKKKKKPKKKL